MLIEARTIAKISYLMEGWTYHQDEADRWCNQWTNCGSTTKNDAHALPIFAGGRSTDTSRHSLPLDTLPLDQDKMTITMLRPDGQRSWLVEFRGKCEQELGKNKVEVRTANDVSEGYWFTKIEHGQTYSLTQLHRIKGEIAWRVKGA